MRGKGLERGKEEKCDIYVLKTGKKKQVGQGRKEEENREKGRGRRKKRLEGKEWYMDEKRKGSGERSDDR